METESFGQQVIFVIILIAIVILSYCAIPSSQVGKIEHNPSEQVQTTITPVQEDEKKIGPKETAVHKTAEKKTLEPSARSTESKNEIQKAANISKSGDKPIQVRVISMNNPLYQKHKKGIVQFNHQNHVKKYLIACGSCHHDDAGKPLELTFQDRPQGCIQCHKGTRKPKGEKLGKKEKIMKYHFEALHANCIGCHKEFNKKNGDPKGKKPAPTSCNTCHMGKKS